VTALRRRALPLAAWAGLLSAATVLGTVVGALVMQVIATSFNMLLLPYALSLVLKAVIILAAVLAQRPRRV